MSSTCTTCPPNSVSNRDGVLRCDGCGGRVQLEDGQWVHARCLHSGCSEPVAFRATKLYGDHRSFYTCAYHEPNRAHRVERLRAIEAVESIVSPPMEGDRVIISDNLAGDVTLAGWENVEITLDTGRVINTHHMHLEPHPVQDGMWYYTRTTPGLNL